MAMRPVAILPIVALFSFSACAPVQPPAPDMAARTKELQALGFGMFVCWSLSTFSGNEWTWGVKDAGFFNPTGFDPEGWCRAAKSAGMGYVLFLTKHHDGFCLWDTRTTDRKVTRNPLGTDVLAKVRAACDRHGLRLALYFSEGEFGWEEGGEHQDRGGCGYHRNGRNPEMKAAQLRELLTRYGPIEFIWFDHAIGDGGLSHADTVALVKSIQPGCFCGFNSGDQTGADILLRERGKAGPLEDAGANGIAQKSGTEGARYRLAEFTYPMLPKSRIKRGAQWFYSLPENDAVCLPADVIYRDCVEAKRHGNIFSLDVGPGRDGRLRQIDVETLALVGRYIRGETRPPPTPPDAPDHRR